MANTSDDAFTALMAAVDPPLIIVTTAVDGARSGCLVGFHAQSSIDPPRYSVWLSKANHTYGLAVRSSHLGVHFLTDSDRPLAALFGEHTGDEVDKFAGLDVSHGLGGVPLLTGCSRRLVLQRAALLDEGGDHVCFVGEVVSCSADGSFMPLRLSQVDDFTPGHPADD